MRTDGIQCRDSTATGLVVLKISSTGCCLFKFYYGPIFLRLSFTPTNGVKGTCTIQKVCVMSVPCPAQVFFRTQYLTLCGVLSTVMYCSYSTVACGPFHGVADPMFL